METFSVGFTKKHKKARRQNIDWQKSGGEKNFDEFAVFNGEKVLMKVFQKIGRFVHCPQIGARNFYPGKRGFKKFWEMMCQFRAWTGIRTQESDEGSGFFSESRCASALLRKDFLISNAP